MSDWIYFDNNATTPIDQEVVRAITQEYFLSPSNPSSIHHLGQLAKTRLTTIRNQIANTFNVFPDEIIFNSGATEGLNTLIRGYNTDGQIISSNIEHSCIYETLKNLKQKGKDVLLLNPDDNGQISLHQIEDSLVKKTSLVILSYANAETGVKNDIESIAEVLAQKKIPFIVDCVAGYAKDKLPQIKGICAMVFSAHKFHGPQGIGFIIKKKSLMINPLLTGGKQEYGLRAGTQNLAAIMGLAKAIEITEKNLSKTLIHIRSLRDRFEKILLENLEGIWINGANAPRVSNTSNIGFKDIDGESLLINLDLAKISASHGSACASGALEPSRVLLNMGQTYKKANSAIRFSFSRMNTMVEVEKACKIIINLVNQLRNL